MFDLSFLSQINPFLYIAIVVAIVTVYDLLQTKHSLRRVYPFIARVRYLFEKIRPELRQYFFSSDLEERPFSRRDRDYIYASAKGENNKIGFGTKLDYAAPGNFHIMSNMFPVPMAEMPLAFTPLVFGPLSDNPYFCTSRIIISAMSFGALSQEAIRALSRGARDAGVPMSCGEGGLTPFHLSGGCDMFVQIGPAKFGFRTKSGELDWEKIAKVAELANVKAFYLKLAQGAKPGAGGILPKEKITDEIAEIRGIPKDKDCHSPNCWGEFSDFPTMFAVIKRLKAVTRKPVGIKIVAGDPWQIHELVYLMKITGEGPDFIQVDGGEGGTGAAPVMLADHVGLPIDQAIKMVDNIFRLHEIRDRVILIASGRVATPADMARLFGLGADMVAMARGQLLPLGCIQAAKCHTNRCPTGIATQDPWLRRALVVEEKAKRVARYNKTMHDELRMLMAACGIKETWQFNRRMVTMVVEPGKEIRLSDVYPYPPDCAQERNPVTIYNLEEYRAKYNCSREVEIPSQTQLEDKLTRYLLEGKESAVDDIRNLIAEAQIAVDHADIVSVEPLRKGVVELDLFGMIKKRQAG